MKHSRRMLPYLMGAAAVAAVLIALGAPIASVAPFAIVLLCPLVMVVMMRSMGGMGGMHGREDHTGHGCEHDPTREAESPSATGTHQSSPSTNLRAGEQLKLITDAAGTRPNAQTLRNRHA